MKEVIIVGYSNVSPEGVTLHTNIPARPKLFHAKTQEYWVSWDKIGLLLFEDYTTEVSSKERNKLRGNSGVKSYLENVQEDIKTEKYEGEDIEGEKSFGNGKKPWNFRKTPEEDQLGHS